MSIPPSAQWVHSTASYAPASLASSITRAISASVSVLREQYITSDCGHISGSENQWVNKNRKTRDPYKFFVQVVSWASMAKFYLSVQWGRMVKP